MNTITRLGLVLGGYAGACQLAGSMVYVYQLFTEHAAAQASGGMYAFSDLLLFFWRIWNPCPSPNRPSVLLFGEILPKNLSPDIAHSTGCWSQNIVVQIGGPAQHT